MNNYNKYNFYLDDANENGLRLWVKSLTYNEKLELIKELDQNEIPVLRSLAYDYDKQEWVV